MTIRMEQGRRAKADTWPKMLKYNYETCSDQHIAMRHKHYGVWQPLTWKDYFLNVKHLALGLLSLGFQPGEKILVIGDNAPQWYYAGLAAQAIHGVSVGVFSDSLPSEIEYIAENSEATFAVVEDQEQVDKLLEIREALPLLKKVVFWNYKGLAHYDHELLAGYREVLKLGKAYEAEHPGHFENMLEEGGAEDVCAIIYTAGTTGTAPKGAVHTFRSLRAGAEYLLVLDPWSERDNVVPYLPPVWIHEQWLGVGCHLLSAATLNFAEASETQQRDSRETGPSIVVYGARVWESLASTVQARILRADAVKKTVFRLLMPVGYKAAEARYRKQRPDLFLKMLYVLSDILLFRSIKRDLGLSNARICYSTGALLSPDAFKFYHALNVPLKGLYGTTEGGALTGAGSDDIHFDTVGPPHSGAEVRTGDAGEIIYRQPGVFAGYYRDPELTDAVLKDGWFYSGDSGFIREDGHLVFTDRIKDLLDLPGGEKLAPQSLESRLRFSPFIKDAWVLSGPDGLFVSAVIVMDYNNVRTWAGQRRVAFTSFAELSQAPEVYDLVKTDIERVNRTMPEGSRVVKYVNLHREFDPDEGELTRTRNLRRAALVERHRALIEGIYGGKTEAQMEAQAEYRDGRTGEMRTTMRIASI